MLFNNIKKIINKKELLSIEHIPTNIVGRNSEIKDLSFEFSYLFRENPTLPQLLIYGNVGTGKTVVVKFVLSELERESKERGIPLKIVYIKGSETRTKFEILKKIYSSISEDSQQFNNVSDTHSKIIKILAEKGIFLLIVIDELHEIKDTDLNGTIFTISRLGEDLSYYVPKVSESLTKSGKSKIGYILVTNDSGLKDKLHDNTKSSLTREYLYFNRYSVDEINAILKARIDDGALFPETIDDGVLEAVSAYSLKEGEDSRYALKLLSSLAKNAEKVGDEKIRLDSVEQVQNELSKNLLMDAIRELPQFYLEILGIIYFLHMRHQKINSKSIFALYENRSDLTRVNFSRIVQILTILEKENIVYVSSSRNTQLRQFSIEENIDEIEKVLTEKSVLDYYSNVALQEAGIKI